MSVTLVWLAIFMGVVTYPSRAIVMVVPFATQDLLAREPWQIGALRFLAALGMGGEWSLGVALINEMRKGNEAGAARIVSGLKPKGD